MSSEHKRPLYAFAVVAMLCAFFVGSGLRSEAVSGLLWVTELPAQMGVVEKTDRHSVEKDRVVAAPQSPTAAGSAGAALTKSFSAPRKALAPRTEAPATQSVFTPSADTTPVVKAPTATDRTKAPVDSLTPADGTSPGTDARRPGAGKGHGKGHAKRAGSRGPWSFAGPRGHDKNRGQGHGRSSAPGQAKKAATQGKKALRAAPGVARKGLGSVRHGVKKPDVRANVQRSAKRAAKVAKSHGPRAGKSHAKGPGKSHGKGSAKGKSRGKGRR